MFPIDDKALEAAENAYSDHLHGVSVSGEALRTAIVIYLEKGEFVLLRSGTMDKPQVYLQGPLIDVEFTD
jgi:hypothetical protein